VLNITTQDIINFIIKIEDSLEDLEAIKAIKEEEEDLKEKNIFISKLIILILL
jgi:hypothetical protein